MASGCIFKNGAPTQVLRKVRIISKFDLCFTTREKVKREKCKFRHTVYLLAKLCNIFDEAFLIDVSILINIDFS